MRKILIKENAELADKHIQQIENEYITRISALANAIGNLGIGKSTKELIIDAITNNSNNIELTYKQHNNIEKEEPKLATLLQGEADRRMEDVRKAASVFDNNYAGIFNGMRINNPLLFDWFDISEDGTPILLDSVKESIKESVRVYTSTNIGAEMLKLQQSLAKDIQKMYDLMSSVNNSDTTNLGFEAHNIFCYRFPMGLFDVKEDRETGRKEFVPIDINFDPEQVENDEPFLDDED